MQELRFVAVSEDGRYAVLAVPGRSARFTLPIDERLRAVAQGQTSRLAQYEIEVESPLRPKEIQARIRAGETVEEIADAAGIAVERVRWFEGPVLAERAYIADQAQSASVRRQGDATPGPRLGEIVTERMNAFGADPEEAQWDAKKRGDGSWQVQLTFISGGRLHLAEWVFDPRRRHVIPADDNAARMSLPGAEPPQPAAPPPGEATVTQLAPRLSSAAGHGGPVPGFGQPGNGNGHGNGGRTRPERPGAGRPAGREPGAREPGAREPGAREPEGRDPGSQAPSAPAAASPEPRTGRHSYPGPAAPAPEPRYPAAPEPRGGRHGYPATPDPSFVEPPAPERPAASAPEVPAAAPAAPNAPSATPGRIASQVSEVAQAPQPARGPEVAQAPQSARGPEVAQGSAASKAQAAPAEVAQPAPTAQPEPVSEQPGRPGRKGARGKRSSVPSWDEIMFGNSRQRD